MILAKENLTLYGKGYSERYITQATLEVLLGYCSLVQGFSEPFKANRTEMIQEALVFLSTAAKRGAKPQLVSPLLIISKIHCDDLVSAMKEATNYSLMTNGNEFSYQLLAYLYSRTMDLNQAKKICENALTEYPNNPLNYFLLAHVYVRLMKAKISHRLLLASEQLPGLQLNEENHYSEASEVVKIIRQGIIRCCWSKGNNEISHGEFPSLTEFIEKHQKTPEKILQYENALLCGINLCLKINEIDQAKVLLVLFNTKSALSAEKAYLVRYSFGFD